MESQEEVPESCGKRLVSAKHRPTEGVVFLFFSFFSFFFLGGGESADSGAPGASWPRGGPAFLLRRYRRHRSARVDVNHSPHHPPPVFVFLKQISGCFRFFFSLTAESFGVSAQIGSGVVWGDPEVRFHEGSTGVPPGFHEGSRVPRGFARFWEGRVVLGISLCFKRRPD